MRKSTANIMLVIVTIIWGGGFIATSAALDDLAPFTILMIRFLGAAILPIILSWKALRNLSATAIKRGLFCGVLLFLAFAFQTFGLMYTTPSKNAFLTATNVILVPYLLWLILKRKPTKKEMLASTLCVIGIALLTLRVDVIQLNIGDLLSFICAIFFAGHMIALEKSAPQANVFAMTALQMISAGVLSAVFALTIEGVPKAIPQTASVALGYSIICSTMLAYLLQTWAQKYTSANHASMILSMEALWASFFSYCFFQETMSATMLIGAAFIFLSVIYIEYQPKKE